MKERLNRLILGDRQTIAGTVYGDDHRDVRHRRRGESVRAPPLAACCPGGGGSVVYGSRTSTRTNSARVSALDDA